MKRNAFAVLAIALSVASCHRTESKLTSKETFPDAPIVVISIDTLRSDRLAAYGSKNVATPNFDRLATESVLFEHAYSQCPLTLPSHLSMLTGLLPQDHGVRDNIGFHLDEKQHPSVAGLLKKRGYATGAAISAYVLRRTTGIASDFDEYDDNIPVEARVAISTLQRSGAETIEVAKQWIAKHEKQPFFYFLHLYEPHAPYSPPEPFKSRYADPYDGEVAYSDALLGDFLDALRKSGVYDRATIIVLSDHGEGLMDHGEQEHGILLNRESIQVPLFLKLPSSRGAGSRVSTAVQLIDVAPTILSLAGEEPLPAMHGQSLLVSAAQSQPERAAFSETMYPRIHLGWSDLRSLTDSRYHYIEAPKPELYDHSGDSAEKTNVLQDERRVYARLRKEMETYAKAVALPGAVSPEEAAKLAALGYISATKASTEANLPDPKDRIGDLEEVKGAFKLVAEHKFDEAVPRLQQLLQRNPNWTDTWSQLGQAYESMGDYDRAIETYKKAIQISPTLAPEFALSLASVLTKAGRYDEAVAHANLALQQNPGGTHQVLGEIALSRGQLEEADRQAQLTTQVSEFRLQGELLSAQVAAAQGAFDVVLQRLSQLERDATAAHRLPFAYLEFVRGDALARMNRNAEAETAFKKEIDAFPLNRQAYANLALIQLIGGRGQDAYSTLNLMIQASPNRHTALFAAKTLDAVGDARGASLFKQRAEGLP